MYKSIQLLKHCFKSTAPIFSAKILKSNNNEMSHFISVLTANKECQNQLITILNKQTNKHKYMNRVIID